MKNIIVSLLCLFLVACGSERSDKLDKVTLATFSEAVDYAPLYVADKFGWLKSDDYEVVVEARNDLASISAGLENGSIQAFFAAAPPIIITNASGVDVRIAGLSCTLRQEIVVRSDSNIKTLADLSGKRIAVLTGTSSHYGLLRNLEQAGIKTDGNITLLDQPPPEAEASFTSGKVDAWAVWPPFVEQQEISGAGRVLPGGDAIIQSVYGVPQGFYVKHPEAVKHVQDAINRAKTWMIANPVKAQSIVAEKLGIDREVVARAWPKHDWSAQITPELKADLAEKIAFLNNQGLLRQGSKITAKDIFLDE